MAARDQAQAHGIRAERTGSEGTGGMGYLIGADIGSQSVKAVLLDPDGRTIGSAGQGCVMRHPASGWAEQDPADWTRGLTAAVRSSWPARHPALAGDHLGLASQVDGVVAVDGKLRPLRPAIIWLDRRATDQAAALAGQLGTERIFATTGLNADASHIAPKLMWLRDNEPATFSRARSFPPVGGYLLGWLTGVLDKIMPTPRPPCCTTCVPAAGTTACCRRPGSTPRCWLRSARPRRSPGR